MKSHTEYLWMNTAKHREYVNITPECARILRESGIKRGDDAGLSYAYHRWCLGQ